VSHALPAKFHTLLLTALTLLAFHSSSHAQPSPSAVLAPGFAIVSGFSGVLQGGPPRSPGTNPADKLAIDSNGVALRVIDTSRLGGPPAGQLVSAQKMLAIPASLVGQVFAIALDDAAPPNIYAAATSVYGLPIVVPDTDGDGLPDRARRGAPNAGFMPGLFGPVQAGGGPGSIWKIDGLTGTVSLFANLLLDGTPNLGPALGSLAYDPASRQIYVADRGSGMIHVFNLDGIETGRFDHGTQARGAIGLPPVAFDRNRRTSIQSPQFDSGNPATWGYAPAARRVFGLAVHRERLYYAVAEGPQIWSVSLAPGGAFGADVRIETAVPPGAAPTSEISKILFDGGGDMLLAERGAPTGAYDFGALRAHDTGRVLRFRPKPPVAGGTPFYWEPVGDYAIGFPPNFQNGDGGIALGYGYEGDGYINLAACGGTLWSTGSQLRISPNPALAQRLSAGGALAVDGLQGQAVSQLRPQNTPPLSSYFIDADDVMQRSDTPGHTGDVATWRACPGLSWLDPMYVDMLVAELWCPAGFIRGRGACVPTPCRAGEVFHRGRCVEPRCPPELRTPVRGLCCPAGSAWNAKTRKCEPPQACPDGRRTRDGACCPPRNGNANYPPECLPPQQNCRDDETREQCLCRLRGTCPPLVCTDNRRTRDGGCCPPLGSTSANVPPECQPTQQRCRDDETREQCQCRLSGNCPPPQICPGDRRTRDGACCPLPNGTANYPPECLPQQPLCRDGETREQCLCRSSGNCPPPPPPPPPPSGDTPRQCPPGQIARGNLCIVVDPAPQPGDTTPDLGRIPPPRDGTFVPPPPSPPPSVYCQGGPFKLVGGTCCAGSTHTCTAKPQFGSCPSGTETIGPPWHDYMVCCRADTAGTCAPPQQSPSPPSCAPVTESRWDRCMRWFRNNPVQLSKCIEVPVLTPAGSAACFSNSDCPNGACCNPDGVCELPSSTATAPPPATGACPPPLIQVGSICCSPETVAAGLCRPPPPPSQPRCTGGKVLSDNVCRCPDGTSENARGVCVRPPPAAPLVVKKKDPVCRKGTHLEGGRCVPNVRRSAPVSPPPQAAPNVSIGIGIGGGGRGRNIGRPGPVGPPQRLRPGGGGGPSYAN
jgi:hypothetical protein